MPDPKKKPKVTDDPKKVQAYQDSLKAYNTNDKLRRNWEEGDLKYIKNKANFPTKIKREEFTKNTYKDKYGYGKHNSTDGKTNDVEPFENKTAGINPYKIGRSTLTTNSGNIVNIYGTPGVVEYPIYKKPEQPYILEEKSKFTKKEDLPKGAVLRHTMPDGTQNWAKNKDSQYADYQVKPNIVTGKQIKENSNKGMVFNETFQPKRQTQIPLQNINPIGLYHTDMSPSSDFELTNQARIPKLYNIVETINQPFGGRETSYKVTDPNLINTNDLGPGNTRTITPQYAYGGQLNNTMKSNDLNEFNTGGTHSQNPLGGIPIGKNNSVEQGETKHKDFIFSDRIKVDKNLISQFNLPGYAANKTFAEASKNINNKFKDRSDKVSNDTKNEMLDRLSKAHEYLKLQESLKLNSQEVPDMMNGQIPEGFENNQMYLGGSYTDQAMSGLSNSNNLKVSGSKGGYNTSYLAAAGNFVNGLIPDEGNHPERNNTWEAAKDTVGSVLPIAGLFRAGEQLGKKAGQTIGGDKGGDIASGFLDPFQNVLSKETNVGEKILSVADPIVSGMIMANKNKELRDKARRNSSIMNQVNNSTSDFAYGGRLKKADGGPLTEEEQAYSNLPQYGFPYLNPTQRKPLIPSNSNEYTDFTVNPYSNLTTLSDSDLVENNGYAYPELAPRNSFLNNVGRTALNTGKQAANWLGDNYGDVLKYAPVAMNAYQLSKLSKPEKERLNRIDQRFIPKYVDERSIQNNVNNQLDNVSNSLAGATNGSLGSLRANLLGAGLNRSKAMSDAYLKASEANNNMDIQGQQFNLGVNQFNTQQDNMERDINARNRAAYDNNKSRLLGEIGTNLGAIGKEESYKKIAKNVFGYSFDGQYYIDPKTGEKISRTRFENRIDNMTTDTKTSNAYGGYLKRK